MTHRFLANLLCGTIISGAALAAPAAAQPAAAPPVETTTAPEAPAAPAETVAAADQPAQPGSDIVVTGSRIPQPNLTSVSPVTVVSSQEVRLQGVTRTEDLINALPQAFAEQGGNLANGATGTATVNLRGLGSQRTLVLINGRRLVPGDPGSSSADINMVPATMIDRVDVLTGGASSVYGSDAVGGVVNFIMDTKFEGIRLDGQYSLYQHDNDTRTQAIPALNRRAFGYPRGTVADGGTIDIGGQIGAAFDDGRGHVVAYATYRKLNAVTQDRRDYSACNLQSRTPAQVAADPARLADCGGSATSANGSLLLFTGTPGVTSGPNAFTSTFFQVGPNRTLQPGFTPFNYAPYNYYQRPDERYTFGAFADYEISPALHPYLEVMFMDDRTLAQIAPSGDFGQTTSVNCDNPLMSAQQRAIICAPANLLANDINPATGALSGAVVGQTVTAANPAGAPPLAFIDPTTGRPYFRGFAQILRRNVEGGGRVDDLQHTDYRIVGGMRGELSDAWSYDGYYQFGRTNYAETYLRDFSVARLTRAIDVVDDPRTPGVDPVCRSVVDGSDPGCVPYDVLGGTISQAAINYVQVPGFKRGQVEQAIFSVSLTGKLGEYGLRLPWAEDGVGIRRRGISQGQAEPQHGRRIYDRRSGGAGGADIARPRRLRRARAVRRNTHPDRREQLLPEPGARGRLPPLRLRPQEQRRPRLQDRHVEGRPRLRPGPRRPPARKLQPRRPRAEHPGAVRDQFRRAGRGQRSVHRRRPRGLGRGLRRDGGERRPIWQADRQSRRPV